jgi:short-subunit dehydrogenase
VYGGTKAFVLALSQSLLRELANKGVRVQVVLPGATLTEFWNGAGIYNTHELSISNSYGLICTNQHQAQNCVRSIP